MLPDPWTPTRAGTAEALRLVVREDLRGLPDEQLQEEVGAALAGMTPEQAEDFWRDVGNFATKALPGAVSGAMAGAALGPYGMAAGAIAGGLASGLSGGGGGGAPPPRPAPPRPPAPSPPGRPPGFAPPRPSLPPLPARPASPPAPPPVVRAPGLAPLRLPVAVPAVPAARLPAAAVPVPPAPALPAPQPAAPADPGAQLLQLLGSVPFQQALLATALGPAGARSVDVGGEPFRTDALLNAASDLIGGVLATSLVGGDGESTDVEGPEAVMEAVQRAWRPSDGWPGAGPGSPADWLAEAGLVQEAWP